MFSHVTKRIGDTPEIHWYVENTVSETRLDEWGPSLVSQYLLRTILCSWTRDEEKHTRRVTMGFISVGQIGWVFFLPFPFHLCYYKQGRTDETHAFIVLDFIYFFSCFQTLIHQNTTSATSRSTGQMKSVRKIKPTHNIYPLTMKTHYLGNLV